MCSLKLGCDENNHLTLDGYGYYRSDRRKNKRAKRGSGGVCAFIKQSLLKGTEQIKSTIDDCLWIVLDKNFFNTDSNLYICCCYLPPSNSKVIGHLNVDVHDILQTEILRYQSKGEIVVIGDLNCRVGTKQEQWVDLTPTDINVNEPNINFLYVNVPTRFCQDTKCNYYGNRLLETLNEGHLLIVNGRTPGYVLGANTYHGYNGSSCVDLCICSKKIYDKVQYFKVLNNPWYTDHAPIVVSIKTGYIYQPIVVDNKLLENPKKYRWNPTNIGRFKDMINSEAIKSKLGVIQTNDDMDSEIATEQISSIIQEIADACLTVVHARKTRNGRKGDKWHQLSEPARAKSNIKKIVIFSKMITIIYLTDWNFLMPRGSIRKM